MAALSRVTIDPRTAGAGEADFSTVIESTQPLVVDRTVRWGPGGYGSHAESSVASPHTTWYFAEGATTGSFHLFYLLQNPGSQAAAVEIRYLRPAPLAPIVKTYAVAPASRRTIYVNQEDAALDEAEISAVITSQNGVPIIAERAMYANVAGAGLRRRARERRAAGPVGAVVPGRGGDRAVLQPVHPGGQSHVEAGAARGPLSADRRPRHHAPAHRGGEQPPDDRRARRTRRSRERRDVGDRDLDDRRAGPRRAGDVVAGERARLVRGAFERRRHGDRYGVGDRRRGSGWAVGRRNLPADRQYRQLPRVGARHARVRGRRHREPHGAAAAAQPPQRRGRRRFPRSRRPTLRRDRRIARRAARAHRRRARDVLERRRRRLGRGLEPGGDAVERPARGPGDPRSVAASRSRRAASHCRRHPGQRSRIAGFGGDPRRRSRGQCAARRSQRGRAGAAHACEPRSRSASRGPPPLPRSTSCSTRSGDASSTPSPA